MTLHWHKQGCRCGWPAGEMLSSLTNRPVVQGDHLMDRKSRTQQLHRETKGSKNPVYRRIAESDNPPQFVAFVPHMLKFGENIGEISNYLLTL